MAEKGSLNGLQTVGALSLSVVSSVSIVIVNKELISILNFKFPTTLTSWHLFVTFFSLHLARTIGLFKHKQADWQVIAGFGVLNGTSIGLLNLCLGYNSVGFYQMTKLAIIPFTVMLEMAFFQKKYSTSTQFSLFVLLLGVGVATITDLQLNMVGFVISILAIITTCLGQIFTNTLQKRHEISSTQLLYQSSPIMAVTLALTGPFVDAFLNGHRVNYLLLFPYTFAVKAFIALSCAIAIAVNFSTFLVIGKTSPITYQVLGHLKTCLVLAMGFMLLGNPFSWRNFLGISIAVVGMVLYSWVQVTESSQKVIEEAAVDERTAEVNLIMSQMPKDASRAEDDMEYGEDSALLSVDRGLIPASEAYKSRTPANEDRPISRLFSKFS